MTHLYNCKTSGDQYKITKFDDQFNVESSYLCTETECQCPAGHRPSCRHRQMLPKFLHRGYVDSMFFYDHDRGGWVQGWKEEPTMIVDESTNSPEYEDILESEALPIQQEEESSTSNQELWLEQNEASIRAEIADSLAPAGLGQASEQIPSPSPSPTIRRRV